MQRGYAEALSELLGLDLLSSHVAIKLFSRLPGRQPIPAVRITAASTSASGTVIPFTVGVPKSAGDSQNAVLAMFLSDASSLSSTTISSAISNQLSLAEQIAEANLRRVALSDLVKTKITTALQGRFDTVQAREKYGTTAEQSSSGGPLLNIVSFQAATTETLLEFGHAAVPVVFEVPPLSNASLEENTTAPGYVSAHCPDISSGIKHSPENYVEQSHHSRFFDDAHANYCSRNSSQRKLGDVETKREISGGIYF